MIWRSSIAALAFTTLCFADASSDAFDVVASMAAALANDNASGFLQSVDPGLPGRAALESDIKAMLQQAEVTSSVAIVDDAGDDNARTLELDWFLQLNRRGPDLQSERRRQSVKCKLERQGKKWRVTSIEPLSLFAPPNFH